MDRFQFPFLLSLQKYKQKHLPSKNWSSIFIKYHLVTEKHKNSLVVSAKTHFWFSQHTTKCSGMLLSKMWRQTLPKLLFPCIESIALMDRRKICYQGNNQINMLSLEQERFMKMPLSPIHMKIKEAGEAEQSDLHGSVLL